MIRYLKHKEIDKSRWDECIAQSVNRRVYAFSWYLDIVCPGWDALVGEDYTCLFPLTHRRKWGIGYLYQPFFAQQLGLFSRELLSESLVTEFLAAVPAQFRFIEIHLNSMNKVNPQGMEVISRVNHELDLILSHGQLYNNYAQNTRRNLKKACEKDVTIGRKLEADELISLFSENYGRKEGILKFHDYETIRKLVINCQHANRGHILGAFDSSGHLSAAAFFLRDDSRIYYLFAASAPGARENGAMFLLIDHFIKENAGQAVTLDFEGGNDPSLGRFYKSFGAAAIPYPMVRISRLPAAIATGLYFARRMRRL
jgi:hypothetical protein